MAFQCWWQKGGCHPATPRPERLPFICIVMFAQGLASDLSTYEINKFYKPLKNKENGNLQ